MEEIEHRGDEKWAEDVRVLEGAHGAVVAREDLRTRKGMEIAEDAEHAGNDGCRNPGLEDEFQPLRPVLDHSGIENCRQGEKDRHRNIENLLGQNVRQHRDRQETADIEDQQEGEQGGDGARNLEAEQEPQGDLADHQQFIRRRLGDDEA